MEGQFREHWHENDALVVSLIKFLSLVELHSRSEQSPQRNIKISDLIPDISICILLERFHPGHQTL